MSKISKAQRNEQRRRAAIRRMRLQTFIAILIPVMDAWEVGLKGGGQLGSMSFKSIETDAKTARYVKMMLGKIRKARDAVVRVIGIDSFDVGKNFYVTADEKLQIVSNAVIQHLPENADRVDQMRVITYLTYMAFYDLRILTDDQRPEVKKLVSALGCLADYLIKPDSPLVMPMNKAYYATRTAVQGSDEVWYELDWETAPQEVWIKEHAA